MSVVTDPTVIRKYMTMQSAWFVSVGLQGVVFPHLLVDRLHVAPEFVGLAQAIITLPVFLLMLPGGVLADRFDGRSILIFTYLAAAIPPLFLTATLLTGTFSYSMLIIFGIAMGILGAFSTPARDSLLNRVVIADGGRLSLQRAVMLASVFMFSSQIIGMLVASRAEWVGIEAILILQSLIMACTLFFIVRIRLPRRKKADHGIGFSYHLGQMKDGVVEAFTHKQIMPVIIVAFCIGIFYVGAFQVILPIQIRENHGGGAMRLAMMSIAFFSGTIISSMILFRRGGTKRAGRALAIAIFCGAFVQVLLSIPIPYFSALVGFVFLWGLGGGVAITMSRSIVQELAPESHRGRLLSVYSMGFMGGAPIGALTMGFLIKQLNEYTAALVPATLMTIAMLILLWRTELWHITFPRAPVEVKESSSSPPE